MNERPILTIPKSIIEHIHDMLCIGGMIGLFLYDCFALFQLPQRMPIHFKGTEPDGWGSPWVIFLFLIIAFGLYILLTWSSRYPHKHNYPWRLSKDNAFTFYRNSKLLLSWLKLEIVFMFLYMNWNFVQVGLEKREAIGFLDFVIGSGTIVVTLILFSIRRITIK